MRILQLTDPHLVAGDAALARDHPALRWWHRALDQEALLQPDCLVVTGDLCQDESWGGYVRMRDAIQQRMSCPVALVPGNHDHSLLLDEVLGLFCPTALTELVARHHPPMASGHPVLDTMNPIDHGALRRLILPLEALLAMLFGHIQPTREPRKTVKVRQ